MKHIDPRTIITDGQTNEINEINIVIESRTINSLQANMWQTGIHHSDLGIIQRTEADNHRNHFSQSRC